MGKRIAARCGGTLQVCKGRRVAVESSPATRRHIITAAQEAASSGPLKCHFQLSMLPVSIVACGDREDFLQLLRVVHFRRKCTTRNNCAPIYVRRGVLSGVVPKSFDRA